MLSFTAKDHERVARGEITVTFRLWKYPHVKAGKTYSTGFGSVDIEEVRLMPAALISDEDTRLSGLDSVSEVMARAGEHTRSIVTPETLLYRVQFRYLGSGNGAPKPSLDTEQIHERLARMDKASKRGYWTLATLRQIEAGPGVPARLLAAELGVDTLAFKTNVRKLKNLGLTNSLDVGYELSDLGHAYLAGSR